MIRRYDEFAARLLVEWVRSDGPSWLLNPFCRRRFDALTLYRFLDRACEEFSQRGIWSCTTTSDGTRCAIEKRFQNNYKNLGKFHELISQGFDFNRNVEFIDGKLFYKEKSDRIEQAAHSLGEAGFLVVSFEKAQIVVRPSEDVLRRFKVLDYGESRWIERGRPSKSFDLNTRLHAIAKRSRDPVSELVLILS